MAQRHLRAGNAPFTLGLEKVLGIRSPKGNLGVSPGGGEELLLGQVLDGLHLTVVCSRHARRGMQVGRVDLERIAEALPRYEAVEGGDIACLDYQVAVRGLVAAPIRHYILARVHRLNINIEVCVSNLDEKREELGRMPMGK